MVLSLQHHSPHFLALSGPLHYSAYQTSTNAVKTIMVRQNQMLKTGALNQLYGHILQTAPDSGHMFNNVQTPSARRSELYSAVELHNAV